MSIWRKTIFKRNLIHCEYFQEKTRLPIYIYIYVLFALSVQVAILFTLKGKMECGMHTHKHVGRESDNGEPRVCLSYI